MLCLIIPLGVTSAGAMCTGSVTKGSTAKKGTETCYIKLVLSV